MAAVTGLEIACSPDFPLDFALAAGLYLIICCNVARLSDAPLETSELSRVDAASVAGLSESGLRGKS